MGIGSKLQVSNTALGNEMKEGVPLGQGGAFTQQNFPRMQVQQMTPEQQRMYDMEIQGVQHAAVLSFREENVHLKPSPPRTCSDPNVANLIATKMWRIVCINKLHNFYTKESLQKLIDHAGRHDYRLIMQKFNIPSIDMATDFCILALYDIVLLGDDSYSMITRDSKYDDMRRWDIFREMLKTISFFATMFDEDGVLLRWLNHPEGCDGLSSVEDVDALFQKFTDGPKGGTPMASALKARILDPIVYKLLSSQGLTKPVLILTITDGSPVEPGIPGEPSAREVKRQSRNMVTDIIRESVIRITGSKYGAHGLAYGFAQVGYDDDASNWLGEIDVDPVIGKSIDCTSAYEREKQEFERDPNNPKGVFNEAVWLAKLMLGPIDPSYDDADEGGVQPTAPYAGYTGTPHATNTGYPSAPYASGGYNPQGSNSAPPPYTPGNLGGGYTQL